MTSTATHIAINLDGVTWIERGHTAFYPGRAGFGVLVVATGQMLSRDGVCPSAWRLKSAAAMHAEYPPDSYTTVPVTLPAPKRGQR
jgi:hypothetical protein